MGPVQLGPHLGRGAPRQVGVGERVVAQLVVVGQFPADQILVGEQPTADQVERGPYAVAAQHVQRGDRVLRHRTVVKGEGDLPGARRGLPQHPGFPQPVVREVRARLRAGAGGRRRHVLCSRASERRAGENYAAQNGTPAGATSA